MVDTTANYIGLIHFMRSCVPPGHTSVSQNSSESPRRSLPILRRHWAVSDSIRTPACMLQVSCVTSSFRLCTARSAGFFRLLVPHRAPGTGNSCNRTACHLADRIRSASTSGGLHVVYVVVLFQTHPVTFVCVLRWVTLWICKGCI